ncbi:MAG: hypothetical protein J6S58_08390, partial [Lentisphaeria bacterium]|nr:hypothetical protein [Lentisphaeria bacterium]
AELHLALQWAHFQTGILYDEHLLTGTYPKDLKVLFVPGLEVVTADVLQKLNFLRQQGVILIGDEFTLPALMLDHRLHSVTRNHNDPAGSKKALQNLGRDLAILLDRYGVRSNVADQQDLILRERGDSEGKYRYLFAVNDRRTFGDYVGQWGLVPEKGVPLRSKVTLRKKAHAAYDLVQHREIPLEQSPEASSLQISLPGGGGKVIVLLDQKIEKIRLQLPKEVKRGSAYTLEMSVADKAGKNIPAILPVELRLKDSAGRELPGSGYYAAENGKFLLREIMAKNAQAGKVTVFCKCLASGKTAQNSFIVK